jgi:hypothetical protein
LVPLPLLLSLPELPPLCSCSDSRPNARSGRAGGGRRSGLALRSGCSPPAAGRDCTSSPSLSLSAAGLL